MSIIEKPLGLAGSKGEEEVVAIFDSGSTYSCITPELAGKLETIPKLPQPLEFEERRKSVVTERVGLDFHLDGYRFSDEFMLIPGLSEAVIIDPRMTRLRLLSFPLSLSSNLG